MDVWLDVVSLLSSGVSAVIGVYIYIDYSDRSLSGTIHWNSRQRCRYRCLQLLAWRKFKTEAVAALGRVAPKRRTKATGGWAFFVSCLAQPLVKKKAGAAVQGSGVFSVRCKPLACLEWSGVTALFFCWERCGRYTYIYIYIYNNDNNK